MILIPLAVVWAGYTLTWYGFCNVKGPGVGFVDLIVPARAQKITQAMGAWGQGNNAISNAAPVAPGYQVPPDAKTVGPLQVGPNTIFPPGSPANPNIPA